MTENSPPVGIKSLDERISKLEGSLEVNPPTNFIEKMVVQKQKRELIKKKNEYDSMINIYIDEVKRWIQSAEPFKMLAKIVEITVRFVEKHSDKIAYLVDLVFDNDFTRSNYKLSFAIDLIGIFVNIIDIDFIKGMISTFVEIMFPKRRDEEMISIPTPKKRKNRFGTLTSIRKLL